MYFDKLSDLGIKLTKRAGSEKTQCPRCYDGRKNKNRRDLSVNITTGEYKCHNIPCPFMGNVRSDEKSREIKSFRKPENISVKKETLQEKSMRWFNNRKISKQTVERFMIFSKQEKMPQTSQLENCICYPYFKNGELVNIKYRDAVKNFKMVWEAELVLFGMQTIGERKHIILCEGENDCMSAYEAGFGQTEKKITNVDIETGAVTDDIEDDKNLNKWATLSVPNGASSGEQKLEYLDNCFEQLVGIHEFIIAVDDDVAGRMLRDELVRRIGVERCKLIEYPTKEVVPLEGGLKRKCKDLNEVLMYLGEETVRMILLAARPIPVEGVYYVDQIRESMLAKFRSGVTLGETTRMGFQMDEHFRWKRGEINLGVGYGSAGKTTFMLQMFLTKSIHDGVKWAVFCPENFPPDDFYDDMVEMYVGKWINQISEDEYNEALDFLNEHFFYVYPEDSHDIHSIHEKFRHLILKKGVDGVLIDPINQLDHVQGKMQTIEQYYSDLYKDIKRFALLNGVYYNILAHPKNPTYGADKSLPIVDMYDIAGGAMHGNKTDNIWSLYRPFYHINKEDPTVEIYFQKIKRKRTGGKLGVVNFTLDWGKKRYADFGGIMHCDPIKAKRVLSGEEHSYSEVTISGLNLDDKTEEEENPF